MAKRNGTTPANGNGRDDPAKLLDDLSPEARRWIEKHPVAPDTEPPPVRTSTVEFTTVIGNPKPKVRSKDDKPPRRGDTALDWARDLKEQAVDWLWEGRIPLGAISLISGDKGAGKSSLACWIAAAVSAGRPLPGDAQGTAGRVLYLNAEEDARRVWKPRLARFAADLGRIALIDGIHLTGAPEDERVSFSFLQDMDALNETVARLADVRLIVVDTVSSYLLSIDAGNGADVRRALEPLKRLAEMHGVAVLLNNHLNKGGGTKAIYRSKDSIDIPNLARMTWLLAPDPDAPTRRIMAPSNCNFIAAPALAFAIDRDGSMSWDPEPIPDLDASGLLAREAHVMARAGKTGRPAGKIRDASRFVLDRLARGEAKQGILQAAAADAGFPESTFRHALKRLKGDGKIEECPNVEGLLVLRAVKNLLPDDEA